MAESKINAPIMNAIRKGQTVTFSTIVSGYVSGSGNYVIFDIPCQIANGVTSATLNILSSISIWLGNGTIKLLADIDTSYKDIILANNNTAIRVTLKFKSTQAINIPCTVNVQMAVAFS